MGFIFNAYDSEALQDGEWVESWRKPDDKPDAKRPKGNDSTDEYKIAFIGNDKFLASIPPDLKVENALESRLKGIERIATTVLKDWRGVRDTEGNEVPFSVENAKAMLAEPNGFMDWVTLHAQNAERLRREMLGKSKAKLKAL